MTGDGSPDSNGDADNEAVYERVYLTITEHPKRPLDGHRLAFTGSVDEGVIDFDEFGPVHEAAHDRYDISDYNTGLYVGQVYFTSDGTVIAVKWEDPPKHYEHGQSNDAVTELPADAVSIDEIVDS